MKKKHSKEKRTLEIPFYKSISLRLIACFLIPVIGILVLGIVSYNSASKAVINSYKKSVSQTVGMQQKYINLAVSSEIDEFKNYFTDSSLRTFCLWMKRQAGRILLQMVEEACRVAKLCFLLMLTVHTWKQGKVA